jgi:hypothetical protein
LSSPASFDHLQDGDLVTVAIARGSRLIRLHWKNAAPLSPGDGPSRFSDPHEPASLPRRFRPIYMADDFLTTFGEVVVRDRRDHQRDDPVLLVELMDKAASPIEVEGSLRLLSLHEDAPTRMGIPTDAIRGSKDVDGRKLSEAAWLKFPDFHGLSYPSRITTRPCRMVYDRDAVRLKVVDTIPLMDHPEFGQALEHYRLPLKF